MTLHPQSDLHDAESIGIAEGSGLALLAQDFVSALSSLAGEEIILSEIFGNVFLELEVCALRLELLNGIALGHNQEAEFVLPFLCERPAIRKSDEDRRQNLAQLLGIIFRKLARIGFDRLHPVPLEAIAEMNEEGGFTVLHFGLPSMLHPKLSNPRQPSARFHQTLFRTPLWVRNHGDEVRYKIATRHETDLHYSSTLSRVSWRLLCLQLVFANSFYLFLKKRSLQEDRIKFCQIIQDDRTKFTPALKL